MEVRICGQTDVGLMPGRIEDQRPEQFSFEYPLHCLADQRSVWSGALRREGILGFTDHTGNFMTHHEISGQRPSDQTGCFEFRVP